MVVRGPHGWQRGWFSHRRSVPTAGTLALAVALGSSIMMGCASEPSPAGTPPSPTPDHATAPDRPTATTGPTDTTEDAAPAELTLSEAVARALRRNPDLVSPELDVEGARGRLDEAAVRPNPHIAIRPEWGFEANKGSGTLGHTRADAELDYTLETAGRRDKRIEVASRELEASQADARTARAQVRLDAERAFDDALATELRARLREGEDAALATRLATAERRAAAGDIATSELSGVRKDRAEAAVALAQAKTERIQGRFRLARAIGLARPSALDATRLAGDPLELVPVPPATDVLVQRAIESRPELEAKRALLVARAARVALEEAKAYPNVDLAALYGRDVDGDVAGFGVGVDLPFFDRNVGAIREAAASRDACAAELVAREATIRADVESAARSLATAREALDRYRSQVLPSLVASDKSAERRFATGAIAKDERADAALDLARGKLAELDLAQAVRRAYRDLEAAVGRPLDGEDAK